LFANLAKAFAQLDDPRLQRVMLWSVWLALGVLLTWAFWSVRGRPAGSVFRGVGSRHCSNGVPASSPSDDLAVPALLSAPSGCSWRVAAAVERRTIGIALPRAQSIHEAIVSGLKFALVAILLNLAVLPVYIVGFFLPPLNFFVFYGLNGYLLGREYYETVALRRLDPRLASEVRRRNSWRVFMGGVVITLMLTVPILNLIAPVIATAFMVHIFESIRRGETPT
jgi:hypothetical protein